MNSDDGDDNYNNQNNKNYEEKQSDSGDKFVSRCDYGVRTLATVKKPPVDDVFGSDLPPLEAGDN